MRTILAAAALLAGCMSGSAQRATPPPLQVREYQTRTYDTSDTKMVVKAVLNVLQDEGFIIQVVNADLGLSRRIGHAGRNAAGSARVFDSHRGTVR